MTTDEWHPTSEELDQLRAGLLDDAPLAGARIRNHLATCEACRQQAELWDQVAAQFDAQAHGDPALSRLLAERRRKALAARPAWRRFASGRRITAAAAVLIVAIAGGVFVQLHRAAPTPAVAQVHSETTENNPDFYSDIDFYVWLSNQKLDTGSARRHET